MHRVLTTASNQGIPRMIQHDIYIALFLNDLFLLKFWTNRCRGLPQRESSKFRRPYSQSYPHKLWVREFPFPGKALIDFCKTISSLLPQAHEPVQREK
jgi:hypothetical protein